MALRYQFPEATRGALIVSIDPESPLSSICHLNDVISKINDRPIESAEDAAKSINERSDHDRLIVSVDRRARSGIERYTIQVP
jgi:S1-C subfamily serine protease